MEPQKNMTIAIVFFFFATTEPKKKIMVHYYCLFFLLKHKEQGDNNNCHRLFQCNRFKIKNNTFPLSSSSFAMATYCSYFLHYNRTREKDDGALPSSSSSQTQRKR
jgi:hypothetical protein